METANARLKRVCDHFLPSASAAAAVAGSLKKKECVQERLPEVSEWRLRLLTREKLQTFRDATLELEYNIADHLPGPLRDPKLDKFDVLLDLDKTRPLGNDHQKWVEYQKKYGDRGLNSNIVIPYLMNIRGSPVYIDNQVVLCDADDAERIARAHIGKQDWFDSGFGGGVIGTNNKKSWMKQRGHLNEAFLPWSSLAQVFPTTVKRASQCSHRLEDLRASADVDGGVGIVDMSEFFLYETMAQLMLSMFGFSDEYMKENNKPLRMALSGYNPDPMYLQKFLIGLYPKVNSVESCGPKESKRTGRPVRGPLSAQLGSLDVSIGAKRGNAFIFLFAGHDTTGHTLTWLARELSRHKDIQRELQAEVDAFWARRGNNNNDQSTTTTSELPFEYKHLNELVFMTRCIHETLRMWGPVPNGTFRQLEFDDYITGEGGKKVMVPKGTAVQIQSWSRHRNPDLWGEDVNEWNPHRNFVPKEVWDGKGLSGRNPATARFSPFTFAPRDCIGKNFANMEMRAIMLFILRRYSFAPVLANQQLEEEQQGCNRGTMGPRDVSRSGTPFRDTPEVFRAPIGFKLRIVPRE